MTGTKTTPTPANRGGDPAVRVDPTLKPEGKDPFPSRAIGNGNRGPDRVALLDELASTAPSTPASRAAASRAELRRAVSVSTPQGRESLESDRPTSRTAQPRAQGASPSDSVAKESPAAPPPSTPASRATASRAELRRAVTVGPAQPLTTSDPTRLPPEAEVFQLNGVQKAGQQILHASMVNEDVLIRTYSKAAADRIVELSAGRVIDRRRPEARFNDAANKVKAEFTPDEVQRGSARADGRFTLTLFHAHVAAAAARQTATFGTPLGAEITEAALRQYENERQQTSGRRISIAQEESTPSSSGSFTPEQHKIIASLAQEFALVQRREEGHKYSINEHVSWPQKAPQQYRDQFDRDAATLVNWTERKSDGGWFSSHRNPPPDIGLGTRYTTEEQVWKLYWRALEIARSPESGPGAEQRLLDNGNPYIAQVILDARESGRFHNPRTGVTEKSGPLHHPDHPRNNLENLAAGARRRQLLSPANANPEVDKGAGGVSNPYPTLGDATGFGTDIRLVK